MYSSTPEQKERLVLPRIIATFGAPGDDMERQEYINRFFDDLDKGKRTLNADAGAFRKAYAQYKEVENNPEQLKALFEKTIERIGKYIQSQPAQLSEKNIVIAAYVKRIENMCEKKGVAVSDETKDLMKGITLLGKFARDSIKAEKALLTNKMEKGQTYKETLKKFATMKIVENRFLKGNGERSIGSISDMAKVLGDGENMQPLMNLVEETKGFHDLMACKPKSRSYIISSSNEITASLYEGISKECMEIRNKVISDVANMKEKDENVKTNENAQVLA
jgi:hypothetical protein